MAKGRKNGCPINIRNWLVYIYDVATADFVRIYGLEKLTRKTDSSTEDGSSETDVWEEPYVSKRSGSLSLEGKRVVVDSTGEEDAGQLLLNYYAEQAGCDADATLKVIDPYGHGWVADYIVTSHETGQDGNDDSETWELSLVGEVEPLAYVAVSSVGFEVDDTTATALALTVGGTAEAVTVAFTPENASNKRFRIVNSNRNVATISNITEDGFVVTPVAAGTTNITVTSINGSKTATLAVTVTAT